MNSVKPQQELDLLANVIERHPEGVSAEKVLQESGLALDIVHACVGCSSDTGGLAQSVAFSQL